MWLGSVPAQAGFVFQTLDNPADPTFNQLLGINNSGLIAGYFGSGAAGHPNQGYTLTPPASFTSVNFPGSTQTQVTGLNNTGTLVGFYAPTNLGTGDVNHGFYEQSGVFHTVDNPLTNSTPAVNQLLGVNNSNVAVGFYNDNAGNSHGYTYNIGANSFTAVNDPLGVSTIAAGINNAGDIVGLYTDGGGVTHGFLDVGGSFTTLDAPGADNTQLLGVNNKGWIVGVETAGGNSHGVIYNENTHSWTVLDAPSGINNTVFNGLNDLGQIVGFYTDANGNTNGLLVSSAPAPETGKGVLGLALLILAYAARSRLVRAGGGSPCDAAL
ncbi:hypothetical protein DSM21852_27290 [Methylocystis bryophila]|uniref:PEP-CTERM protein-sorting domain-containing protein n=2 Tax=Methylocystis bryophila TaxID=655015 RepID=A0A1W6MZZ7_9HYPH|nr:hypothetical protein B1812_21020 [Methylocystis bryophila]BDV39476.1 hypothetical protein DSM21852_27290 [Methylocystis bryophila]